jgi:hypothetical protein
MYVCLKRICTHVYCASEGTHGILGKLGFVPSMRNSLRPSVPRHIFLCERKRRCLCISTHPGGHNSTEYLPLGNSLLGPSNGCSTIVSNCLVNP